MTSPWTDGEFLNAATLYARITALITPLATVQQRAQYTQTAASAITTASTYIKLTSMTVDVNDIGLTASSSTLTFPAGSAGRYEVSGRVSLAGVVTAGGTLTAGAIYLNGASAITVTSAPVPGSFITVIPIPTFEIVVAVGDTLELRGYVNATGVSSSVNSGYASFLRIRRVA